ncbi:HTH-type transcriptional regulator MtrR [Fundidesulfovibrio magnetotacticus]|uniref:HTH-type transcriptional regulator MtrR n=1 Tax=Fundidesulfovibrio magnetotacticus TaxID=2730080 RepID=A0A6V8M5N4_9BACT|nr:TetR/AcrR family transcriptional regulator [Fundidesulfovibrio magnetotacticus]GFK95885.1 HTH-type transcriptional regulator MtrR [Fundidesulfovibrio magnetotacticus]
METTSTFQNIPTDKQLRVLTEARAEFAERGFLGASMNRLAARLGIAKGSLFKYFGSKEGLFAKVFDQAVDRFSEGLRQARDETAGLPLAPRLERILDEGTRLVRQHPDIYRIYLKMLNHEDFPLRERFLSKVRALSTRFLTPVVLQARDRGELPPDLDPDLAVFVLDAVLDRFVLAQAEPWMAAGLALSLEDPEAARRTARKLAALLAGMLRANAPNPSPPEGTPLGIDPLR